VFSGINRWNITIVEILTAELVKQRTLSDMSHTHKKEQALASIDASRTNFSIRHYVLTAELVQTKNAIYHIIVVSCLDLTNLALCV
jgi:hypothetical protein